MELYTKPLTTNAAQVPGHPDVFALMPGLLSTLDPIKRMDKKAVVSLAKKLGATSANETVCRKLVSCWVQLQWYAAKDEMLQPYDHPYIAWETALKEATTMTEEKTPAASQTNETPNKPARYKEFIRLQVAAGIHDEKQLLANVQAEYPDKSHADMGAVREQLRKAGIIPWVRKKVAA